MSEQPTALTQRCGILADHDPHAWALISAHGVTIPSDERGRWCDGGATPRAADVRATAEALAADVRPHMWIVLFHDPAAGMYFSSGPYTDEPQAWKVATTAAESYRRQPGRHKAWATVVPIAAPAPGDRYGDVPEPPVGTILRVAWAPGSDAESTDAERCEDGWVWTDTSGHRSRYRFQWDTIRKAMIDGPTTVVRWGR